MRVHGNKVMRSMNRMSKVLAAGRRAIVCSLAIPACLAAYLPLARAAEEPVRRVVVALYDGDEEKTPHESRIHRFLTMPLNHLGLVVRQFDIRKERPSEALIERTRGVVTWFTDKSVRDPDRYVSWLWSLAKRGRSVVILGHPGIVRSELKTPEGRRAFDSLFERLGIHWQGSWVSQTFGTKVSRVDTGYYEFERKLPMILPGYPGLQVAGAGAKALLSVTDKVTAQRSDLVVVSRNGGYVAGGYAMFFAEGGRRSVQRWYLNPFRFFAHAFRSDNDPKPDTTTLSGRRIFYSHIDGDAWHSLTNIEEYHKAPTISAKVIYDRVLLGFPDLPHTVAPVTGDLDKNWYGTAEDIALARTIFSLPNVEAGTHTHSHPFSWRFLLRNDKEAERPFLNRYPARPRMSQSDSVWGEAKRVSDQTAAAARAPYPLPKGYSRPRAYAVKPFDLRLEILGSVEFLEKHILPRGKRVKVIQWSGDTAPNEAAISMAARAGLANINGGDPRMDGEFNTYSRVSALGRRVGAHWQVYSSGANDHVYTNGWRRNFAGFKRVVQSFERLESPIRLKPINIYYHLYSAQRKDGLNALLHAFRYARAQRIAPVRTSHYSRIVQGFFSTRIVALGGDRWRIEKRGDLQTIRFDHATMKSVDFARSRGVIGQNYNAGSLYVALDRSVDHPIVALRRTDTKLPKNTVDPVYLVDARWEVWSLKSADTEFSFWARGFGSGAFQWKVPRAGRYRILVTTRSGKARTLAARADAKGLLSFKIATNDTRPRLISVTYNEGT